MNFKSILPNRFFWWCAGADVEVLEHCPTEHRKYTTLGAIIFIVACIASFSMFFAISTVIKDAGTSSKNAYEQKMPYSVPTDSTSVDSTRLAPYSDIKSPPLLPSQGLSTTVFYMRIAFALLWGILILLIDRLMVSTINPWDSTKNKLRKSVPRFILALIIATVISRPIEIQIFWDEIQAQVFKNNSDRYNAASKARSEGDNLPIIQLNFDTKKAKEDSLAAKASQNDFGSEYTNLLSEKTGYVGKLKSYDEKIRKYKETKNQYSRGAQNGQYLTKIKGDLVWVDVKPLKDEMDRKINSEEANKRATGFPAEIIKIDLKLDSIRTTFLRTRSENKAQLEDADRTLQRSNTDFLKFQQEQEILLNKTQYSFAANLDGLSTLGGSTQYAVWFVFLLFLVLELLPITVKLMTPAGNFDTFIGEKEKYDKENFIENLKVRNRIVQRELKKREDEQSGQPYTPTPAVPSPQNEHPHDPPQPMKGSDNPRSKPLVKSKGNGTQKNNKTSKNKNTSSGQSDAPNIKRHSNPDSFDDGI